MYIDYICFEKSEGFVNNPKELYTYCEKKHNFSYLEFHVFNKKRIRNLIFQVKGTINIAEYFVPYFIGIQIFNFYIYTQILFCFFNKKVIYLKEDYQRQKVLMTKNSVPFSLQQHKVTI